MTDDTVPLDDDGTLNTAFVRAKARGTARAAQILAGPDMLSAEQFAELIGETPETLDRLRTGRHVLALANPTGGYSYPDWQVLPTGDLLPCLAELFEVRGDHPWAMYRLLVSQHAELEGQTALETLRSGQCEVVVRLARSVSSAAFS